MTIHPPNSRPRYRWIWSSHRLWCMALALGASLAFFGAYSQYHYQALTLVGAYMELFDGAATMATTAFAAFFGCLWHHSTRHGITTPDLRTAQRLSVAVGAIVLVVSALTVTRGWQTYTLYESYGFADNSPLTTAKWLWLLMHVTVAITVWSAYWALDDIRKVVNQTATSPHL